MYILYSILLQCIAELLDLDYVVARGDENADGHILSPDDYAQLNLVFNKGFKMLTQLNQELAGKTLRHDDHYSILYIPYKLRRTRTFVLCKTLLNFTFNILASSFL